MFNKLGTVPQKNFVVLSATDEQDKLFIINRKWLVFETAECYFPPSSTVRKAYESEFDCSPESDWLKFTIHTIFNECGEYE